MNPWDIIGWIVLAAFGVMAAIFLWAVALVLVAKFAVAWRVWRDRNVRPEVGQVWQVWNWYRGAFESAEITKVEIPAPDHQEVWPTGRIRVEWSRNNWNFLTPEEWRDRKKFLLRKPKEVSA